jgi:hypothetical protein
MIEQATLRIVANLRDDDRVVELLPVSRMVTELWRCSRHLADQGSGCRHQLFPITAPALSSPPPSAPLVCCSGQEQGERTRPALRASPQSRVAHPRQPTHLDMEELAATARSITSSSPRCSRSLTSWPPDRTASPWTALAATHSRRRRCLSAPVRPVVPLAGRRRRGCGRWCE